MGQFFTEFILSLQASNLNVGLTNSSHPSALSVYSNNALCNLIEFSEQRFVRDELTSQLNNNTSPLNHSHLFQPNQLLNHNNHSSQQQANFHPQYNLKQRPASTGHNSNCSSPGAISQLSGTLKSDDHSNHSYASTDVNITRESPNQACTNVQNCVASSNNSSIQSTKSDKSCDNQTINTLNTTNNSRLSLLAIPSTTSSQPTNHQSSSTLNSAAANELKFSVRSILSSVVDQTLPNVSKSSKANFSSQNQHSDKQIIFKNSNKRLLEKGLNQTQFTSNITQIQQQRSTSNPAVAVSIAPAHISSNSCSSPIKPSTHFAINQLLRNSLANALLPASYVSHQSLSSEQASSASSSNSSCSSNNKLLPILSTSLTNNSIQMSSTHLQSNTRQKELHPQIVSSSSTSTSSKTNISQTSLSNNNSSFFTSQFNHHLAQLNHTSSNHRSLQLNRNFSSNASTGHTSHSSSMPLLGYPLNTLSWMSSARGKPRRGMMRRAVFSDAQRQGLEKNFQKQKYISKNDRKQLADSLGLKDSQVKIWFQNRRMKWRNCKERELLSHGGSREQTLPTKNNPNPDLTDVGTVLSTAKLRSTGFTVQQLRHLKQKNLASLSVGNLSSNEEVSALNLLSNAMDTDTDEIDIEGYSDEESQDSNYDKIYPLESPIKDSLLEDEEDERSSQQTLVESNLNQASSSRAIKSPKLEVKQELVN